MSRHLENKMQMNDCKDKNCKLYPLIHHHYDEIVYLENNGLDDYLEELEKYEKEI